MEDFSQAQDRVFKESLLVLQTCTTCHKPLAVTARHDLRSVRQYRFAPDTLTEAQHATHWDYWNYSCVSCGNPLSDEQEQALENLHSFDLLEDD